MWACQSLAGEARSCEIQELHRVQVGWQPGEGLEKCRRTVQEPEGPAALEADQVSWSHRVGGGGEVRKIRRRRRRGEEEKEEEEEERGGREGGGGEGSPRNVSTSCYIILLD